MNERISTLEVRQRLGDLLNRVALRHDEFIIERKGRPLAALVSLERLEQMRRLARRRATELFARQEAASAVDEEDAMNQALEAQRWVRRASSRRRRTK